MTTASPPKGTTNSELIRWAFERINHHDAQALKQFWTAETIERFPDRTCVGADEIAAYFEDMFAACSDLRIEIQEMAEQGDNVFVRWHLTGTHDGPLFGIAPTGRRLEVDGIDHFVIREGRVISNFVVADQMQYARAIGMMPPDGSAADRAMKAGFNVQTAIRRRLGR